jgi:hypothetical protein
LSVAVVVALAECAQSSIIDDSALLGTARLVDPEEVMAMRPHVNFTNADEGIDALLMKIRILTDGR